MLPFKFKIELKCKQWKDIIWGFIHTWILVHQLFYNNHLCFLNMQITQDQVPTINMERAHMFLKSVHIYSNKFDEKAQCGHRKHTCFLKTCAYVIINLKRKASAHLFLENVHICSKEFDKKVKSAHMFLNSVHIYI